MEYLQENINLQKYNRHIESLYNVLKHMFADEICLNNIVRLQRDIEKKEIISIQIKAKGDINSCLRWKSKDNKIVGSLSCSEIIDQNDKGDYVRRYFSFHFQALPYSNVKTFRIDFKPEQETPLHAHDDNDEKENRHLTYPYDTSLNLKHIDFCTIMLVISFYINHRDKYPLFNGKIYNPIINRKRRRYDEYREH